MTSQEDDATELQFPKDEEIDEATERHCFFCDLVLHHPYINCSTCHSDSELNINICLNCFSKGKENSVHKNNHDYLIKDDLFIFASDWKAKDELQFLNAVKLFGHGNWTAIGRRLNKNAEECKKHFLEHYVQDSEINNAVVSDAFTYSSFLGSTHPPRPNPDSILFKDMSGYNAARSDFATEYLNDAEDILSDVDFVNENDENFQLYNEMNIALVDIYRRQLGERMRRKRIVRDYGMIGASFHTMLLHYKCQVPYFANMIKFVLPLLLFDDFSYLMESLAYHEELITNITELKECRANGLKKQSQIAIYKDLKSRREQQLKRKQKLLFGSDSSVMKLASVKSKTSTNSPKSRPLDIIGKPEYDTLSDNEKELSSQLRLLPANFNRVKTVLIAECKKWNGLTLRNARSSLKMDVNKIRKIYDYMIAENLIYNPEKK